jgi:Zinc carboxypeptidase
MPPAPPPNRAAAGAFHYHTYSYPGDALAGPFAPWAAPLPIGWQMYSLQQDLAGLAAWGAFTGVPNIAVNTIAALPGVPGGAQTIGGNDTIMLSLGPGPGVVNAPAVVFTGGIHAREWIAIEFVYLLAEYLVRHYTNIPVTRYQQMIKSLVDSRRIYIIPMLNPDGNIQTVFGAGPVTRLWRKNRRVLPANPAAWVALLTNAGALGINPVPFQNVVAPGGGGLATYDVPNYDPDNGIPPAPALPPAGRVTRQLANNAVGVDANRNFRTLAWGYDGQRFVNGVATNPGRAYDPNRDPYFGPQVESEVETVNTQIALAHAAAAPGISVSIDYHSFAQAILYPSETAHNGGVGPDYTVLGMTLRQLVRSQAALDYALGTPREIIEYDAPGTVHERAAQQHQSRAFTIELDPPRGTVNGFVLPEAQIIDVFEKNIRGALAALAAPGRPANWFTAYFQAFPMAWNMLQFMTWNVYNRGNQLPL